MRYHTDQPERADATTRAAGERAPADPPEVGRAPELVDGDGYPVGPRQTTGDPDPVSTGSAGVATGVATPAPAQPAAQPAAQAQARAGSSVAFHDRWQDIQLRFVDDPGDAASRAQQLVAEVVDAISAMLSARKGEIDAWSRAERPDTEQLRQAIQRYRELLDQLVSIATTDRGGSAETP